MNKKLLSLYSLKFNPFSPEIPAAALCVAPPLESFCWRIEQQVGEGGFALAIGDPGTGKSAALRLLAERLGQLRDVTVGVWVGRADGTPRAGRVGIDSAAPVLLKTFGLLPPDKQPDPMPPAGAIVAQ